MVAQRYHRKIIKIRGQDSPNVRLAFAQIAAGKEVTNEVLIPGVLTYQEYLNRRATWFPARQKVGLDAEFPEGEEDYLFPQDWLLISQRYAETLGGVGRTAEAMGIDSGQGVANTCWAIVDEMGIIVLESLRTPDTSVIANRTIALINQYGLPHDRVAFDRGGGGLEHADQLRERGYDVRTVGFGEAVTPELHYGLTLLEERVEQKEARTTYKNRRAEMYGRLSDKLRPLPGNQGFAIPAEYGELLRQMSLFPRKYNEEGVLYLPGKNKRDDKDTRKTLIDIIGHSPDESDALVLANYAMDVEERTIEIGRGF